MIESDFNLMDYLTQIVGSGCVPIRLNPETKTPKEPFQHAKQRFQKSLNALEAANLMLEWTASGFGVGVLLTSDFWVLDCDSQAAIDWVEEYLYRNGIECPRVKTPHGIHYYFRVPPGLRSENLKNHICHPTVAGVKYEADFKFGPQSMVVSPGSVVRDKAGQRVTYHPLNEWCEPPIVHPHKLIPGLSLYHPANPKFAVDDRPLDARISRARHYLARHARVSISDRGGRATLAKAMCHLTVFLGLDPDLAVSLMTKRIVDKDGVVGRSWNDRCVDVAHIPYPWSPSELRQAAIDSLKLVPAYGVWLLGEQARRKTTIDLLGEFLTVLASLAEPDSVERHTANDLRAFFLIWSGLTGPDCTVTRFGSAISRAIDCGWVPMRKVKIHGKHYYIGVAKPDLTLALCSQGPSMGLITETP